MEPRFRRLATLLPKPKAILSISAHWYVPGTYLTGDAHPKTIHDFGGFPDELLEMEYPAPGDVALANRVAGLLDGERASLTTRWGLDHGTWRVLHHLRPDADCLVVELSIDADISPVEHLAIGRKLVPLRNEGILIMGSGNIVHNLGYAMTSYRLGDVSTPPWAARFDEAVGGAIERRDGESRRPRRKRRRRELPDHGIRHGLAVDARGALRRGLSRGFAGFIADPFHDPNAR